MNTDVDDAAQGGVSDEALNRAFETAYSHLFRFGALANAGGIAACVGFLGATLPSSGVAKVALIPFAMFVCGILCIWLSLIVVNERLADAVGTRDKQPQRPLMEKIAELLAKPFDNGVLLVAPFALFCLGVIAGFTAILFA